MSGTLKTSSASYAYYSLRQLEADGHTKLGKLPFSIRILLEAALRGLNNVDIFEKDILNLAGSYPKDREQIIAQAEYALALARRDPRWFAAVPDYSEELY